MVDSSRVREVFSAVRMIAELVPTPLPLQLNLPPPIRESLGLADDGGSDGLGGLAGADEVGGCWCPYTICAAVARQRGLMCASSGEPDTHNAGLLLLRAAADGVLGLCFAPPRTPPA